MGRLSDKWDRSKVLIISFVTLALSLFFLARNSYTLGVFGVLFGSVQRLTSQILSVACIADIVPKKILGTAIGLLNLLFGLKERGSPL
ncbi:hypothetical protein AGMMS49949_07530 [Alphaproteobacteria bacterium]|nr:hypothetical protein AGMMS49949_07530 [Alphaproteobacteria bacterium]GHS99632.1 hypothetical protein AGMMS50296_7850 [Alphaproteobacteria bacterium]